MSRDRVQLEDIVFHSIPFKFMNSSMSAATTRSSKSSKATEGAPPGPHHEERCFIAAVNSTECELRDFWKPIDSGSARGILSQCTRWARSESQ